MAEQIPLIGGSLIGRHFSDAAGELCEVRSACDIVVVVRWLHTNHLHRSGVVRRGEWDANFVEVPVEKPTQIDMFGRDP